MAPKTLIKLAYCFTPHSTDTGKLFNIVEKLTTTDKKELLQVTSFINQCKTELTNKEFNELIKTLKNAS